MKIRIIITFLVAAVSFSSCKKWIDVKPTDRMSEQELFSNLSGYQKALNGIYLELANNSLYGQNMTMSVLDVMAQYYFMPETNHRFYTVTTFDYGSATTKAFFEGIWSKSYELILNCNTIIDKCGESNSLLPGPYFGIIKGEALALRAMLHFDLLRIFGPIWSDGSKGTISIPYNTSPSPKSFALLSAEQVMKAITDDLAAAAALLKNADPVITEGVRNEESPTGNNDLYYRQYRLNYYAVKALLARTYLWKQDKAGALREAKEILADIKYPDGPMVFPFVTKQSAESPTVPDRVFSTEVFFSLYTINRQASYTSLFAPEREQVFRLKVANGIEKNRLNEMYDDGNDYRLRAWEDIQLSTGSFVTFQKYKTYVGAPGQNMVPLIRLSEILLIAAECSNSVEEGTVYLNAVRKSRNSVSLTPANADDLQAAIGKEFKKEVIGEGQMFFYYKRNASPTVPNHIALTGTKPMVLENYVVPLPDSELSVRGN